MFSRTRSILWPRRRKVPSLRTTSKTWLPTPRSITSRCFRSSRLSDISEHYPDLLKILPKDAIAVAWDYNPLENFDKKLKPFADAGLSLFVSPGVNDWNRMVPYYGAAYTNIRNFIRDGQKYHAIGAL